MAWLMDDEPNFMYCKTLGLLPARKTLADRPEFAKDPAYAGFIRSFPFSIVSPYLAHAGWGGKLDSEGVPLFQQALVGKLTAREFLGGFAAALLLHQSFRGRAVVRTVTLLPWIVPGVVVALVWEWLYQPNYGVINDVLLRTGVLRDRVAWLSDPGLAMPAVIATNVWRGVPFFAIMLLAGLQAIPEDLYQAARLDGTPVTRRFWHITLPLLRPIIIVATATRVIWTFNYADLIFVMTGGGPANATQITSTYTLLMAYANLDFGYAATLSVVLLVIMLVFTVLYLRVTRGIESVT